MAITQLSLFNDALGIIGSRSLVATSDPTEPARVLTSLWDQARRYCLEQGQWKFAERQASLTAIAPPAPAYGLTNAFAKPSDFVRLNAVAADASFDTPVLDYHERGGHFYSNSATLHIQYVSNDTNFGHNLALWPESFALFFTYYLAVRAVPRIAPQRIADTVPSQDGGTSGGYLAALLSQAYQTALEQDAIGGGSTFLPEGQTTQLSIFNAALSMLGLRTLRKVTDATETAKLLLNIWDSVNRYCLEQAPWAFAEKQTAITGVTPTKEAYALTFQHEKPCDFIRLNAIGTDAALNVPVTNFHDRGGYWYTDSENIQVAYVSSHQEFGFNTYIWPEAYVLFVTRYLAYRAATRINPALLAPSQSDGEQQGKSKDFVGFLESEYLKALRNAVDVDGVMGGTSAFWDTSEPSQLSIFNNAMRLISGTQLVRLTDATDTARQLHSLWPHARDYCLEQGRWKFAEREVKITASLTEIPTFGFRKAFLKPTDMIRVNEITSDEYFSSSIVQIHERGDYWYCDLDTIYVRYISKDASFGYDITKWPESFVLFVTLYLATRAAPPNIKPELIRAGGNVGLEQAKKNALSKDAVSGPTQFLPRGNWSMARGYGRGNKGRNSRSSLYGE